MKKGKAVWVVIDTNYTDGVIINRFWFFGWFYKVVISYDFFQNRDYAQEARWFRNVYTELYDLPEGVTYSRQEYPFDKAVKNHPRGWL